MLEVKSELLHPMLFVLCLNIFSDAGDFYTLRSRISAGTLAPPCMPTHISHSSKPLSDSRAGNPYRAGAIVASALSSERRVGRLDPQIAPASQLRA